MHAREYDGEILSNCFLVWASISCSDIPANVAVNPGYLVAVSVLSSSPDSIYGCRLKSKWAGVQCTGLCFNSLCISLLSLLRFAEIFVVSVGTWIFIYID